MASEKITAIIDSVKSMTVLELKELVDTICEEFGVSAVAAAAGPAVAAAGAAPAEEEKTEFDVELTAYAEDKKLKVIKEVKDIAGLSLGEAKDLVTSCPKTVKSGVSKEEAESIKKQLEDVGATVTIK